jgi:hypothetical protein
MERLKKSFLTSEERKDGRFDFFCIRPFRFGLSRGCSSLCGGGCKKKV